MSGSASFLRRRGGDGFVSGAGQEAELDPAVLFTPGFRLVSRRWAGFRRSPARSGSTPGSLRAKSPVENCVGARLAEVQVHFLAALAVGMAGRFPSGHGGQSGSTSAIRSRITPALSLISTDPGSKVILSIVLDRTDAFDALFRRRLGGDRIERLDIEKRCRPRNDGGLCQVLAQKAFRSMRLLRRRRPRR